MNPAMPVSAARVPGAAFAGLATTGRPLRLSFRAPTSSTGRCSFGARARARGPSYGTYG